MAEYKGIYKSEFDLDNNNIPDHIVIFSKEADSPLVKTYKGTIMCMIPFIDEEGYNEAQNLATHIINLLTERKQQ